MKQRNIIDIKPGTFFGLPENVSTIVSMCEHNGHLYLAKSDGVFRWNEQQQKFEQLQFVKVDE